MNCNYQQVSVNDALEGDKSKSRNNILQFTATFSGKYFILIRKIFNFF